MLALAAASCNKEAAVSVSPSDQQIKKAKCRAIVEGQYIVQVSRALADAFCEGTDAAEYFAKAGAIKAERLYPEDPEWEERHREAGLHRWYTVNCNTDIPATKASQGLLDLEDVVYLEPFRNKKSTAIFDDPYFSRQWQYQNLGNKPGYKAGADINVVPVWENYTGGSSDVIVAIVDGGIDMTHPDLASVVVPAGINGSKNFIKNNYTITAHDHGTHVAGTVGAINNNGTGVAGVAGGLDGKGGVRLMSCQVFNNEHEYGSGFYQALTWAADHGAVIAQNSWGDVYENENDALNSGVGAMQGAIDYFIRYAGTDKKGNQTGPMKGGVVIFAAGNDGWRIGWPAAYDGGGKCIAVGSYGAGGTRAYYSNYGDNWCDIAAPGGDQAKGNDILSTLPGGYGSMQGTSMACPHVSGVAALIVSYFGGPGFTNDMLVERLLGGANPDFLPSNAHIGPMVDAYGSFIYGNNWAPERVENYTVTAHGNSIDFEWTVGESTDADKVKAHGYALYASKIQSSIQNLNCKKPSSDVICSLFSTEGKEVSESMEGFLSNLEFNQTYYVAIAGYDYNRNYSALSNVKQIKTKENSAPVVETSYKGDYKVRVTQTLNVDFKVYDPDHHSINVTTTAGSRAASITKTADDTYRLTVVGSKADDGFYKANITATDEYGAKISKDIEYEILPNHAPAVVKNLDDMLVDVLGRTFEINMEEYLVDEDEEVLSFEVSHTNDKIAYINAEGNILYLTSLSWGFDNITISAIDARGASCDLRFKVNVRNPQSDADIYPTQVSDVLYVSGGASADTHIRIFSPTGQLVFDQTLVSSAFAPAAVDMSGFAPGIYTVEVTIDGKTTTRTVVRL